MAKGEVIRGGIWMKKIEDVEINCNVCLDLMPLVKDKVASDDSEMLVAKHIENCESCKALFSSEEIDREYKVDDRKVISNIKSKIISIGLIILIIGGLLGIYLSNSQGMFYNVLIMPCIGIAGCVLLRKKYYWVPVGIFTLSYLGIIIQSLLEDIEWLGRMPELFIMPLFLSIIYTILVGIGTAIGALFGYVFGKESKQTMPWIKRLIAGVLGIFLMGIVLWGANDLLGNPISAAFATHKVEAYVAEKYPKLDLEVGKARYNFKFNNYMVNVSSKTSIDTHFTIEYRKGTIQYDGYESYVQGKFNTRDRLGETCAKEVISLLSRIPQLEDNTAMVDFVDPERLEKSERESLEKSIVLDMSFNKELTSNMFISIRTELTDTSAKNLEGILKESYVILKEEGYEFKSYGLFSETKEMLVMIDNVTPEDIVNGQLLKALEEAEQNENSEMPSGMSIVIRKREQ